MDFLEDSCRNTGLFRKIGNTAFAAARAQGSEGRSEKGDFFKKILCYNFNNGSFDETILLPVWYGSNKKAAREVIRMAYEILKSIVEAEARAAEIKRQAAVQAEEEKANALKRQETLLEEAKLQGRQEMQTTVEKAVEESQAAVQQILQEAEQACLAIREQAAQRKEEAVKAVIGKVVGTYGSC